jgi:hypothetical protein
LYLHTEQHLKLHFITPQNCHGNKLFINHKEAKCVCGGGPMGNKDKIQTTQIRSLIMYEPKGMLPQWIEDKH